MKNTSFANWIRLIYGCFLFALLSVSIEGQIPTVGIIDFYGLRSVSKQQIRQALQIKEGDKLPESSSEVRKRLESLPNVRVANLNVVCCEGGKAILYVGISEEGSNVLKFRPEPVGKIRLPDYMIKTGKEFENALSEAVLKGENSEDDSQGHALFNYPKLRTIQEKYIFYSKKSLKQLRTVLRKSSDAKHRALAIQIIAYHKNKPKILNDLVWGMNDANENVRNNSMRALSILASFAKKSTQTQIKIPFEPFIEKLNSIEWTDRNKSSIALVRLTEDRNPAILSKLRQKALDSLVEMSRWKSSGHAASPFILLGRIGNFSDEEIYKALNSGNRESLIKAVLEKIITK
ncbi:MAG: HEAT repeat domain-containing protein [Pyrinomonadaceae bacterium]|nr:HEAT repeat domain-containing protein [Pyrinomonadaceae bacterium]